VLLLLILEEEIIYLEKDHVTIGVPVYNGEFYIKEALQSLVVQDYKNIIRFARGLIPEITITTDIIVGFPGETQEDFENTLALVQEIEFDYAFMFKYSPRKGTLSSLLDETITEKEKKERLSKLIALQNDITYRKNKNLIGKEREILVLGGAKRAGIIGKDAAGKLVVFEGNNKKGSLVKLNITKISGWTPIGKVINE